EVVVAQQFGARVVRGAAVAVASHQLGRAIRVAAGCADLARTARLADRDCRTPFVVGHRQAQRTAQVKQARAAAGVVVEVARRFTGARIGERHRTDGCHARAEAPVRLGRDRTNYGRVLDGVVGAEVGAQLRHHRLINRRVAGRREVREHVEHGRVLAAERHAAVRIALQADECLTTEQTAALLRPAIVKAETAFQHEQRLQAAAQVFGATQTPARTGQAAAGLQSDAAAAASQRGRAAVRAPCGGIGVEAGCQIVVVFDRQVDDAVQRHARLRICSSGKCAHRGKREVFEYPAVAPARFRRGRGRPAQSGAGTMREIPRHARGGPLLQSGACAPGRLPLID
uniref:Uncharacterized protein n=1 Tax=Solanum lycopersicum TaxID=4081 RepID=A0A494G991_SOLLC